MGADSKIEWCDHTFNPWVGCTKVSPACDHCYAESWAKRAGSPELWHGARRRTTAANWRQPLKWNREAEATGVRKRVFCASLADVFDNQALTIWRDDLWSLIAGTPHLDWLLLTKRPQNIATMLPKAGVGHTPWPWPNVWLGATVESQEEADRRIPHLLGVPAAVHFLSCEPLLGPVDIAQFLVAYECLDCFRGRTSVTMPFFDEPCPACAGKGVERRVDWVIVGGESGPGARPMHPDWARSLRDQCQRAGVAFHFKQHGEWREAQPFDEFDTAKGRDQKTPAFIVATDGTVHCFFNDRTDRNSRAMLRVGKKAAGRVFDGRTWDEVPEART